MQRYGDDDARETTRPLLSVIGERGDEPDRENIVLHILVIFTFNICFSSVAKSHDVY